jgi:hypothetical protein
MVRRRVRHPRTPGFRLVEPTARREGWLYPRSQQVIHEISGLALKLQSETNDKKVKKYTMQGEGAGREIGVLAIYFAEKKHCELLPFGVYSFYLC